MKHPLHIESAVQERYAAAAACCEPALCCAVDYDPRYLKVIPREVIERDYGCGDPSRYLRPGETVLDLGSGTGKICFIAAQVVGSTGRVIGVDMTGAMLAVARRNAPLVAARLGFANVEFRKGRILDLALDLDRLDAEMERSPGGEAGSVAGELRRSHPLVAAASVDVVVSNCVLNLVEPNAKQQLFAEIFRVLRPGGRAVISDIVSDVEMPLGMQADGKSWSGCISGALTERAFVQAFRDGGFPSVEILKRDAVPWQTVQGIEFRSMTLEARKSTNTTALQAASSACSAGSGCC